MRILHLSDVHFGAADDALVDAVVARTRDLDPDLVVASGDFTMAGRAGEFEAAAEFLRRLRVPVVATPGNHDLPVYNLLERFLRPLRRYDRWIGPLAMQQHHADGVALCSLNSARPWDLSLDWSHGRLSDEQIASADAFFAKTTDAMFRALVVHHPFYVPEELPGFRTIGNADAMLDVLARHRVHAVLSGHLHQQSVTARELPLESDAHTVMLLQVASATSSRRRRQPNAFNVLDVDEHGVVLREQVEDEGAFRETSARRVIGPERETSTHHDTCFRGSLAAGPNVGDAHDVDRTVATRN